MESTKKLNKNIPTGKISYEQLESLARQLSDNNKQLVGRLQEAENYNLIKRLEFLFEVIKLEKSFPEDFLNSCREEIIYLMTPQAPEESKDSENIPTTDTVE